MNRNGMLTTASEPVQNDYNLFTGESYSVTSSSVLFWILKKNEDILRNDLLKYDRDFEIEVEDVSFSEEFGPSYEHNNEHVVCLLVTDNTGDNELFRILAEISREFF